MPTEPTTEDKIMALKNRLGIFRVPLGVFLLLVTLFLVITPLTPGSLITLTAGLELLNLREKVFSWFKRKDRQK